MFAIFIVVRTVSGEGRYRKTANAFCKAVATVSLTAWEVCKVITLLGRNRDYFMVGECVRFLFTSCEGSLNE